MVAIAGGGFVQLISNNQVSATYMDHRWEPSSSDSGNWVTSWNDLGGLSNIRGLTSAWTGTIWASQIEHQAPGGLPIGDLNLGWDPQRWRHVLAMIDLGALPSVWYKYSLGSTGAVWSSTAIQAMPSFPGSGIWWDFPSIAINGNGRIVISASAIWDHPNNPCPDANFGYYSVVSTDGGTTWNGPYQVVSCGGGISRLVASGSGFHAFILDRTNPSSYTLWRHYSADGITWTQVNPPIAQYGMPLATSPGKYSNSCPNPNQPCNCSGTNCGPIAYASEPDVAGSSSGLGWVIAFPVNGFGMNWINVATELGGGVTISHTTDLFLHGISTSPTGDWWLNYETYTGAPNRFLRLFQGVVYRTYSSSYLGATIVPNIDPKSWFFFQSPGFRCRNIPCFAAGDYMHPASNPYTGASIPVITQSSYQTDLRQSFVQDPAEPNVPQFLPTIRPFAVGTDLRNMAIMTSDHVAQFSRGTGLKISTMASATRGSKR
jgi:hypothetical protein